MKKETLLPVRVYGDDILSRKITPVAQIDQELLDFARDLTHTMYKRDGVGMAANQVGKDLRMFVVDTEWSKEDGKPNPTVMLNPEIISGEGETDSEEGCLSVPGIYATVKRKERITISYTDLKGVRQTETATGYRAIAIQHENDHLDGVLFIDHLSKIGLLKIKRRLKAIAATAVDGVNIREDIYTGS